MDENTLKQHMDLLDLLENIIAAQFEAEIENVTFNL